VVIAMLDLGVIGGRYRVSAALEPLLQVADHVAFGVIAAISPARRAERTR
jgi:hypothetical protein